MIELSKKQLYGRVEEIEYLLRYYCLDGENLLDMYTKAIGGMGEAHSLISKLMDDIGKE